MSMHTMLACCFFVCNGCTFVPCTRMGTRSSIGISCAFDKTLLKDKGRKCFTCYGSVLRVDSALRVTTALYMFRQPATFDDNPLRVTTARYIWQQRATCYDSKFFFSWMLQESARSISPILDHELTEYPPKILASWRIATKPKGKKILP